MPRQGDGSSDNAIPRDLHHIIHGPGPVETTRVDRADKAEEPPKHEKGLGPEGLPAAGGSAPGKDQPTKVSRHAG